MTRECSTDYRRMIEYIQNYSLSKSLDADEYLPSIKRMHKSYFAAITWHAELLHRKSEFISAEKNCNDQIFLRISEVVSDLGSALFNWVNGDYKASKIMLRVSIENFVKAVSALDRKDQLTEKNLYKIFEYASGLPILSENSVVFRCYNSLHSDYKLLCGDTHTAAEQNMQHLTSLADFPIFQKERSSAASEIFIRVSTNITSIFCILFNWFFHTMHHRNRDNILNGLPKSMRPSVMSS